MVLVETPVNFGIGLLTKLSEEVEHDHVCYLIVWKLACISVYASRGLIVIYSGMIVLITTTSIKT